MFLRASVLGHPLSRGERSATPTRLPFRGRDAEIAEIDRAIHSFRNGRTAIVELVGEGGLGKSRLIEETLWHLGGLRVIQVNGSPFAQTQGYFALHGALRSAAALPDDNPAEYLRSLVLRELPDDGPLLPLLGAAFGCEFPETRESRAVAEQFRSGATNRLVRRFLQQIVGPKGVVFVVDDSHWLDEASCTLIRELIDDDSQTWFFLMARRPEPSFLDVTDHPALTQITLTQLDPESAMMLAEAFSLESPMPDELLRAAVERSGGSPLLLELVLEAFRSGATITDLPEEAERLIAARFDALTPNSRELLRSASVLGMDVSADLLVKVLDMMPEVVASSIDGVGEFLHPDGPGTYRFRHALVRETAYEGLSFAVRRRLHTAVVEAIESGVPHVGETVSLLAIHASAASLHDRTWKYAREATEIARRRGLLSQAAELARAAVNSARFIEEVASHEIASVSETLGDIEQLAGRPLQAQKAFAAALRVADQNDQKCRVLWKRADSQTSIQRYASAGVALDRVLELLAEDRGRTASRLRAEALRSKAVIRYRRGKNAAAFRLLNEAWAEAERADDDTVRARINSLYGVVETATGSRHAGFYISEAVRLLRESNQKVELAKALGNLGFFEHFNGRWNDAVECYEESARVADAAGDVITAANARNNVGEILSDRGDLDEAEKRFLTAQRSWITASFALGVALATSNLGRVAMRRGDLDGAQRLYTQATSRFSAIGDVMYLHENLARQAECKYAGGDYDGARTEAERILKPVRDSGQNPPLEAMLLRIIGTSELNLGLPGARSVLNKALSLAEAFRARYEEVMCLEALVTIAADDESNDYRATLVSLRRSLGVVSSPLVLPPAPAGASTHSPHEHRSTVSGCCH